MIRKADTPEARKFWEGVEKAAEHCPEWAIPHMQKAIKEQVRKLKAARLQKNIANKIAE